MDSNYDELKNLFRKYAGDSSIDSTGDSVLANTLNGNPNAVVPQKRSVGQGLADFLGSLGQSAAGMPIDMQNKGWESSLAANIGSKVGAGLIGKVLFGGQTGSRLAAAAEPTLYNTPDQMTPVYKQDTAGNIVSIGNIRKGSRVLTQSQANGYNIPADLKPLSPTSTAEEKQAFLNRFTPDVQTEIQSVADYTIDPTKALSLFKSNAREQIIKLAKMYNPDFDMKSLTAAQQYQNPNTKVGQNITSLNTLVGHIGYMKNSIDNLKASGQPLVNAVILTARNLSGDPTITDYRTAAEVVNNEAQRALSGVGVTQEGMLRQGAILPTNKFGAQQAQQYISAMSHIVDTRLKALETGYKQQVKRDPGNLIRYPETQDVFNGVFGNQGGQGNTKSSFRVVGVR
jgi:hypothetical protein